jgi:glucokinase
MSRRLAIGIDIGGTKIAVAAIGDAAQIHAREEFATEAQLGFDRALGRMVDTIDRTLERAGWSRSELCGVGVGCAGPVHAASGIINKSYTLPT